MASVINTNTLSMVTQQNLSKSQNDLSTSMERLSSGMRINSAKDDAAGQAIANRMSSQITGLSQAQRNANDGISIAQTAEGGLNQVNDNLQRIRELTVQAQNGTNSASDIDSIQQEVNLRLEEINRIATETDFNGNKILSTSGSITTIDIQVGSEDGQKIGIEIAGNQGWNKYTSSQTAATSLEPASNGDRQIGANGFDVLSVATTTETAQVNASVDSEIRGAAGNITFETDASDNLYIVDDGRTAGSQAFLVTSDMVTSGGIITADLSDITAQDETGFTQITGGDETVQVAGGDNALASLDAALKEVDSQRSSLGAIQNRFESAITNLQTNETNLSSARSRIEDADYADEVSSMTTAQILQQAGTSMLTQANQVPQNVLSLLG
ncbi:FliC/FljB family flagellin [Cobetia amphilecti]|uniref:FliC/FljB family flagellin n=1 Tax=Cobetia amphilecti TaxID=1055104 RepID=UPI0032970EA0